MKKILSIALISLAVIGCSGGMSDGCWGWKAKDMDGSGQVKRVGKMTPQFCPDYSIVDISLGVMRDGKGSMSVHDMELFIEPQHVPALKLAAEQGEIIKFTYDVRRTENCVPKERLTSFTVENAK